MKRLFEKLSAREQSLLLLVIWALLLFFAYYSILGGVGQIRTYREHNRKIVILQATKSQVEDVKASIGEELKGRSNAIHLNGLENQAVKLAREIWPAAKYNQKSDSKTKKEELFDQHSVKITFEHAQWDHLQDYVDAIKFDNDLFLSNVQIDPKYTTRPGSNKEKILVLVDFKAIFTVSSLQLKGEIVELYQDML